MNNKFGPRDDESLRQLMSGIAGPETISDSDVESLLAATTPMMPLDEEQVQSIVSKVNRLLDANRVRSNSEGVTEAASARHAVSMSPQFQTMNETSTRPVSRSAVAALMASLLALISVVWVTSRTQVRNPMFASTRDALPEDTLRTEMLRRLATPVVASYQLTAKPLPETSEAERVVVGDTFSTGEFERRRVLLPDGSVLYVNQMSQVSVANKRRIEVTKGGVFVEVVSLPDGKPFEVNTQHRTVTAIGTKFAVDVDDAETDVMVTQGKVTVSGINDVVLAGQQIKIRHRDTGDSSGGNYILTAAWSAASELDWTRDLIAEATGPLVPKSEYAGGALVTVDPNGQSSQLSLRKYHVDVHIEDGFARTTIDQTYFNHTHSRLEGTFYFPLPPDASLSRLAMYVNGKLMEGGMAERDHARNTFEEIKRKMLDPALLEWVDGSTFKMRVFPLEPRQEKRIILSYSQRLQSNDGQMTYRFPAGHTMDVVREWSASARIKGADGSTWHSPSHELRPVESTAREDAGDLLLEASLKNTMLDRDLVLILNPASGRASALRSHALSAFKSESQQYLMLRLRPDLTGDMERKPHHWVFLFEHSGDRTPLLARAQIEILRTLLNNAEHSDTFSIVKASTRATLYSEQPLECSPENITAAVKHLENVHLVGAMDLTAALKAATQASGRASALRVHAPIPADPRFEERVDGRQIEDQASGPDGPTQSLPVASAQWQSILAEQHKLSGDGTPKTYKNRTARAVPLQIETQSDCHWASATGEISARMKSPEGATHFLFAEMCRAFSPLSFFVITPGPHGPGSGFVGPSGPESPVAKAPTGLAHGGLTPSRSPGSSAVFVHLGSGHTALGDRDAAKLVELLPKDVPYIGIGIGKRWNQSLMNLAASHTGGLSVQINPDEDIAWRAFEVFSKMHSPRLVNVKLQTAPAVANDVRPESPVAPAAAGIAHGGLTPSRSPGQSQAEPHFLLFSDTICQGEELAAICRVPEGQPQPTEIIVTATLNGQPWSQTIAVENIKDEASYLPRHWARLEIDRLLAENAVANREAIVALSKSMYVMSPFTSLLVLENDEMYTQFNVDRGRKDHWAMYACPEQISVVVENGDATHPTDSTIDGEIATTGSNETDVVSTIVRIPEMSWPMFNYVNQGIDGFGRQPQYSGMPTYWSFQQDNLRFDHFATDDLGVVSNRYVQGNSGFPAPVQYPYYEVRGAAEFFGTQNIDTMFLGYRSWEFNADRDGIQEGIWLEPQIPTLPGEDVREQVVIPDFAQPPTIPSFELPQPGATSGRFMARSNVGLGSNEASPLFARQPMNNWDLSGVEFETMLGSTIGADLATFEYWFGEESTPTHPSDDFFWLRGQANAPVAVDQRARSSSANLGSVPDLSLFRANVRRLLLKEDSGLWNPEPLSLNHLLETEDRSAIERAKLGELIADIRGSSRGGDFDNQLNSVELSTMLQRKSALDARTWNELQRRREQFRIREQKLPPLERQTLAGLRSKSSIHLHDAEFQSVIQQLSTSSGVNIAIDVPALQRAGISEKQLVSIDVDGITLKSALNLLLDQVGDLTYRITGDVVTIRPTLQREQNGGPGLPSFVNTQTHRWSAAQTSDGASLISLPVFNSNGQLPAMVNPMIFTDLMSHAPGLNTSTADTLAVVEAEASISNLKFEISNPPAGRVDEAARELIEKARGRGWESVTIGGSNHEPGITIHYDGQGRHVWERMVSEGLREHSVCDGSTLWHVYRDIGLASKRPFSRFHHRDFSHLVPWLLPSANELARDADVIAIDERTVAIVPVTLPSDVSNSKSQRSQLRLHLIFDTEARLIERQLMERSEKDGTLINTILQRTVYSADGVVKVLDRDNKELLSINLHRAIAAEPKLTPDLIGLVVLPMPVRTPEVILERAKPVAQSTASTDSPPQADHATTQNADLGQVGLQDLSDNDAIALMLAYMAKGNGPKMIEVARERFIEKGDTRDGLYVLLSRFPNATVKSAEQSQEDGSLVQGFDIRPSAEGSPIKQYCRQAINWTRETWNGQNTRGTVTDFRIDAPEGSFLNRMATSRNLYVRWSTDAATKDLTQGQVQADVERAIQFVSTTRNDDIAWLILTTMKPQLATPEQQTMFANAARRFEQHPRLGQLARRQRMETLFAALNYEGGFSLFSEWLNANLTHGIVPPIGAELYRASSVAHGQSKLDELMMKQARQLANAKMLMTLNLLSVQMRELGNSKVAEQMMTLLLESLNTEQRPEVSLVAIEQLRRMKDARADKLLEQVMVLPGAEQMPGLWRFASKLAEETDRKRLSAERLERALQMEFATRPATINIETVRKDYTELLAKYDELITAAATLEIAPPVELAASIIQAADQWRTLDDDDTAACQTAARLLAKLKKQDLAWDYLITPLAENSGESAPWIAMARNLSNETQADLADIAWTRAFEFETTNPEILFEHATMLHTAHRPESARTLLTRIVDQSWQPRFSKTIEQARQLLASIVVP